MVGEEYVEGKAGHNFVLGGTSRPRVQWERSGRPFGPESGLPTVVNREPLGDFLPGT